MRHTRTPPRRGRDASCLAPPAQTRTCSFPAYGSHLGYPRRIMCAVCRQRLEHAYPVLCPVRVVLVCRSPRPLPLAPPAPQRSAPSRTAPQRYAPLCSSASQLLWQSSTSRARASSATTPRLPDADRPSHSTLTVSHEISQLPTRSVCT